VSIVCMDARLARARARRQQRHGTPNGASAGVRSRAQARAKQMTPAGCWLLATPAGSRL